MARTLTAPPRCRWSGLSSVALRTTQTIASTVGSVVLLTFKLFAKEPRARDERSRMPRHADESTSAAQ